VNYFSELSHRVTVWEALTKFSSEVGYQFLMPLPWAACGLALCFLLWRYMTQSLYKTPKIPWLCFQKEHSKTATSHANYIIFIKVFLFIYLGFDYRILHQIIKVMCGFFSKKLTIWQNYGIWSEEKNFVCILQNMVCKLWTSWLKTFVLHIVKLFYLYSETELEIHEIYIKIQKILKCHLLSKKRNVGKGKTKYC
jgi:hypothetical protein